MANGNLKRLEYVVSRNSLNTVPTDVTFQRAQDRQPRVFILRPVQFLNGSLNPPFE